MQCNRTSHEPRAPAVHLLGGGCLLWLYLITATPLAPLLTALLAVADSSHHVAFQQTARGLQVVLQHDWVNSATHRHGMVARTLTLFAQGTTGPHPDHVIQFCGGNPATPTPALTVAPSTPQPAPESFPPCDLRFPAPRLSGVLVTFPRPPPTTSGLLLTVRSTILVL